jgi:hypothetical protein
MLALFKLRIADGSDNIPLDEFKKILIFRGHADEESSNHKKRENAD